MRVADTVGERDDLGEEGVPAGGDAGHVLELAGDHDERDAGEVADQHGAGEQVGQEPEPGQAPEQADAAHQQGERRGEHRVPVRIAGRERGDGDRGHQGGRGLGPDRELARRPEHGVGGQCGSGGPQPGHRGDPGELRIRQHLRHQVRGDGEPGDRVPAHGPEIVSAHRIDPRPQTRSEPDRAQRVSQVHLPVRR
ncbi:hypothetical protein GCM10009559_31450 [Pseudonocardia zijingensis]|uniref:Uncharacterized protein n=1 Tax=Pseudonocardia zijingensis TaxID=153376 RepID=A0ABP4AQA8_9PSEU